jgi:hypothetical protein
MSASPPSRGPEATKPPYLPLHPFIISQNLYIIEFQIFTTATYVWERESGLGLETHWQNNDVWNGSLHEPLQSSALEATEQFETTTHPHYVVASWVFELYSKRAPESVMFSSLHLRGLLLYKALSLLSPSFPFKHLRPGDY